MKKIKKLRFKKMGHIGEIKTMHDGTQYEIQPNGSWKRVMLTPLGFVLDAKEKGVRA